MPDEAGESGDVTRSGGEDPPAAVAGTDPIIGATLEGLSRAADEVASIAEIAETLQRSMLGELPQIAGLRMAARYVAGGTDDAEVGGDWYDVVPLRGGRAGIAIGDVVGHGIEAATRMAHMKSALRAYALDGLRPAVALERMNGYVRELEDGPMATLLYGVLDPNEEQLRLASAGHPPPLVLSPSREPQYAEGRAGSPLGVTPFPTYEEIIVTFPPGSLALLYTDGLVERPDAPIDAGLEWLRGFAGEIGPRPEELCAALLDACFRSAPPRDDVALLAIGLEATPVEGIALTLPANPESLAPMRRSVGRWLRAAGASDVETYEILVACGEACSNAVAHAYPPGEASYSLETQRAGEGVEVRVRDHGRWREPAAGSPGRGLVLIETLVDRLEIDRGQTGTVVSMWRRLDSGGRS